MERWLVLLIFALPLQAAEPDPRIAITIDDLPWAQLGEGGEFPPQHAQLVRAIAEAKAPVTGFVNEIKLESGGKVLPERERMLRDWLDAGADLGNHTYAHVDLHAVGLEAYEADILRGERRLRPLLAERGLQPCWFRHPY